MENQRLEENKKEKRQISLWTKLLEQQRERFDYAETSQWILDDKFDTDLVLLQDKIFEWLKTAKNDVQRKTLNELVHVCFRSSCYVDQMRTLNKATVAKYVMAEKRINALHSEIKLIAYDKDLQIEKLAKDLETAKKEIEFLSK